ncbi:MAG: GTP-binding protein [Phycisphaeraceae bacterium]|nr:GTP-binding protein [Phycisphaeraceae bacterium]
MSSTARITIVTAPAPGAVAMIQIHGPGAAAILRSVTGHADWPAGRMRLATLAGVDQGLAVMLRPDWAQLMPHGGPRVVRQLVEKTVALGAVYEQSPSARDIYPEAVSDIEADMLAALARAASPAAVDLLLAQPCLWTQWLHTLSSSQETTREDLGKPLLLNENVLARSRVLDRLIDPPAVVVVGRPNVGKSTLTNRMLGRSVSIVADLPGTTRDWVAGLAEIQGVAVRWLDTPGVRATDDPIESRAITLASRVISSADVLIAMRDHRIDWPAPTELPREPDIWVINKSDQSLPSDDTRGALPISAQTGEGLELLTQRILTTLGLTPLHEERWAFSDRLKKLAVASDIAALAVYLAEK